MAHRRGRQLDASRPSGVQARGRLSHQGVVPGGQRVGQNRPHLHRGSGLPAGQSYREVFALIRQGLGFGGPSVHVAHLEQAEAVEAVGTVVSQRLQQAGQQRGAHHRLLCHQRVGHDDAVGSQAGPFQITGRQEGQRHDLVETQAEHRAAHPSAVHLAPVERSGESGTGDGAGDPTVAVDPGNLLDHVDLGGAVRTEAGDHHIEVVPSLGGGEPDRLEDLDDAVAAQVCAEDSVHPGHPDPHRLPGGQVPPLVGHPRGQGGLGANQLSEAPHGQLHHLGVGSLLEAGRRLTAQPEPA